MTEPVAVVAMACRFPGGATSPEAFWQLLAEGRDGVGPVPPERWDNGRIFSPERDRPGTTYCGDGGFLTDPIDAFDAGLFGITPVEASALDPQQRLLLEVSWELWERAAVSLDALRGSATGVFIGMAGSDYHQRSLFSGDLARIGAYDVTGGIGSTAAGRLAYVYDLHGPAMAVDSACSSSLLALDLAVSSLEQGRCDAAVAGGVSLMLGPEAHVCFSRMHALSPTGRCRAFAASADGFVRAEGCGLILLKRLSDARAAGDPVLAVIRATAVNQDGRSNGLTAPNPVAQAALLRTALARAGLAGADIDYLEAHGTGTPLGDPIELEAVGEVLCADRTRPLVVGSVKTNIGHAETAAGIAGAIKVVLALQHGTIPANLHFDEPSPHVPWAELPVVVAANAMPWPAEPGRPRRAGVSAFGFGGTNVHAIFEEAAEARTAAPPRAPGDSLPVLCLSARDPAALDALVDAYRERVRRPETDLGALAAGAARRSRLPHRAAAVLAGPDALDDASAVRRGVARERARVAFAFTGQGAQHAGMARQLHAAEAVFRDAFDACAAVLDPLLPAPLAEAVFDADPARLNRTGFAQPALFAVQTALGRLLLARGFAPVAFVGHSIGDVAAAHLAGVLDLGDACRLVAARGGLMDALPDGGGMAALDCDAASAAALIAGAAQLEIAAENGPRNTVISGSVAALDALAPAAAERGMSLRRLVVSHAFHSALMEPMLAPFRAVVEKLHFAAPRVPLVFAGDDEAVATSEFWVRHVRRPVRFAGAVRKLFAEHRIDAVIELGPHPVLRAFAAAIAPDAAWLPSLRRGHDDRVALATLAAEGFVRGLAPPPPDVAAPTAPALLPTYPFQRVRYWLEDPMAGSAASNGVPPAPDANGGDGRVASVLAALQEIAADSSGMTNVDARANLLDLGVDSLMLMTTRQQILNRFGVDIAIGQFFEQLNTLERIAAYVAERLPAVAAPVHAPAIATPAAPTSAAPAAPASAAPAAFASTAPAVSAPMGDGASLMARQLEIMADLMNRQLDVLRAGGTAAPTQTAEPATATVVASPVAPVVRDAPLPAPVVRDAPLPAPFIPYARIRLEDGALDGAAQQAHLDDLIRRFDSASLPSKEATQRYRAWFANNRNVAGFRPAWKEMIYQIVAESADGAYFDAIGGRRYLDVTMGFGVHMFGHKPAFVQDALRRQLELGLPLGPIDHRAGEIARDIAQLTGVERVAFCNSGTEAVMLALRVARTATNRTKIVLFESAYHGSFDGVLAVRRNRDGATLPGSPGTPAGMVDDVIVLKYGDPSALDVIRREGAQLAAVLVEPIQSRQLHIRPVEFLRELRTITQASGTALIFDEVVSGFRHHLGGCQALFGITADIVTYGKVIGGGMPIGLVAGKAEFVDAVDGGFWSYGDDSMPRKRNTFVAGTFTHHPLTLAAMRAVLDHLAAEGPALQEQLTARTTRMCERLNAALEAEETPIRVVSFGSLFRFYLPPELELLFFHMIERGLYVWEGRNCFLSTAHGDAELEKIHEIVLASVADLRRGGFLPPKGGGVSAPPAAANGIVAASTAAPSATVATSATAATERSLELSLFYFGSATQEGGESYDLLIDGAKFADRRGFSAVWTPERHFNEFGGLYPNPCVTAAALATVTERVRLRAGSTVILLHDALRFAENWAMVDRMSGGRVDLALALGWNANDFVLAPDAFAERAALLPQRLAEVQALWRGAKRSLRDGAGNTVEVEIHPKPVQRAIPIWITAAGNPETFALAGRQGCNVLTYLEGQSVEQIAAKIALYRRARAEAGHATPGHVSLMLHTFVGDDDASAVAAIRAPLRDYLRSSLFLRTSLLKSLGRDVGEGADVEPLLDRAVDRYVQIASLIGSPDRCAATLDRLQAVGVDEVACLIDFGLDRATTMQGLERLAQLKDRLAARPQPQRGDTALPMTDAQRALWMLCRASAGVSRAYVEAGALRWSGPLDVNALREAFATVVARHDALRWRDLDGDRLRVGAAGEDVRFEACELDGVEPALREAALVQHLRAKLDEPFDVASGPLARLVVASAGDEHALMFAAHHLVVDGWSIGVVLRELAALYTARVEGGDAVLAPASSFRDFVAWQAGRAPERARALEYWRKQLAALAVEPLPTDRPRAGASPASARTAVVVEGAALRDLRRLARETDVTLVSVLLAGWRIVLGHLLRERRVAIAVPVAGQVAMGETALVGPCSTVLPAIVALDDGDTAEHLLCAVQKTLADLFQHSDVDLTELPPGELPAIALLFNHDRVPALPRFGDATIALLPVAPGAGKAELVFNVIELPGRLLVELEFRSDLFERSTAEGWLAAWRACVTAMAADPHSTALSLPRDAAVYVPERREHAAAVVDTSATQPTPRAAEATADDTPARLLALWRHVLRRPDLSDDDDFFAASGQSLQAVQLVNAVRTEFATELPLASLFELRTVRAMARKLGAGSAHAVPIPRVADADDYPLSAAQRRMWLMQQAAPSATVNAIAVAARIDGPLDTARLRRAFDAVVERHEILRTVYVEAADGPRQRVGAPSIAWDESDAAGDPGDDSIAAALLLTAEPFDLSTGPLLRVRLLRFGASTHGFALALHHANSDGTSLALMLGELAQRYETPDVPLAPLALQYRDYCAWSNARAATDAAARRFWRERLTPLPPPLALAPDFERSADAARPAATATLALTAGQARAIRELASAHGATPFAVLGAVALALLQRLTGQRDVAVATAVSGRFHPQLSDAQGLYVNTVILRSEIGVDEPFASLVEGVRRTVLDALAHGDYPFDLLVDELGISPALATMPITPVMIAFHDERTLARTWGALRWTPLPVPAAESAFDLTFHFVDGADGLELRLDYRTDVFRPTRVALWLERFAALLDDALARPDAALADLSWQPAGAQLPVPELSIRLHL